jgi:hypothetical protein
MVSRFQIDPAPRLAPAMAFVPRRTVGLAKAGGAS